MYCYYSAKMGEEYQCGRSTGFQWKHEIKNATLPSCSGTCLVLCMLTPVLPHSSLCDGVRPTGSHTAALLSLLSFFTAPYQQPYPSNLPPPPFLHPSKSSFSYLNCGLSLFLWPRSFTASAFFGSRPASINTK